LAESLKSLASQKVAGEKTFSGFFWQKVAGKKMSKKLPESYKFFFLGGGWTFSAPPPNRSPWSHAFTIRTDEHSTHLLLSILLFIDMMHKRSIIDYS